MRPRRNAITFFRASADKALHTQDGEAPRLNEAILLLLVRKTDRARVALRSREWSSGLQWEARLLEIEAALLVVDV